MSKKEDKDQGGAENSSKQKPPPSILAWSVRGLSLAIIVGLIVYFTSLAIAKETPPNFEFTVLRDKIEQRQTGWVVPVNICNKGSMGINALKVKATLDGMEGESEKTTDITLLGPGETVSVSFWYQQDPRGKKIACEVISYLLP